jgi:hypothetical protein
MTVGQIARGRSVFATQFSFDRLRNPQSPQIEQEKPDSIGYLEVINRHSVMIASYWMNPRQGAAFKHAPTDYC